MVDGYTQLKKKQNGKPIKKKENSFCDYRNYELIYLSLFCILISLILFSAGVIIATANIPKHFFPRLLENEFANGCVASVSTITFFG